MNFLVKVKKLVKMNLKKWSGSVTCCYGFVFDISQNGDAKRKEKKTQNCHHKLIQIN